MNIALIGGTFDDLGGNPYKIIRMMYDNLFTNIIDYDNLAINIVDSIFLYNGGHYENLEDLINNLNGFDIILWFPNIPNDKFKYNIKEIYPKKMLVTSKRNFNEYNFAQLINHALKLKSNLLVEFSKSNNGKFFGRVIDPLGVVWCDYTDDFIKIIIKTINRAIKLSEYTRKPSFSIGNALEIPDNEVFFNIIKNYAETFHKLINPDKEVTRFLGNGSFRCNKGFPSFRSGKLIMVSKRNIDKRFINKEGFVATRLSNNEQVEYYGDKKPSVDTPIQLKLYNQYPHVNYMLHSHVYIKDAPFTDQPIPCGAIEEFEEIKQIVPNDNWDYYFINLIGHGSLVMSVKPEYLLNIPYVARPIPEIIEG